MEEIRLNWAVKTLEKGCKDVKTLEKERPRKVFLDLVMKEDNEHFTL